MTDAEISRLRETDHEQWCRLVDPTYNASVLERQSKAAKEFASRNVAPIIPEPPAAVPQVERRYPFEPQKEVRGFLDEHPNVAGWVKKVRITERERTILTLGYLEAFSHVSRAQDVNREKFEEQEKRIADLEGRSGSVADADVVADLRNLLKAQQAQLQVQQELIISLQRQVSGHKHHLEKHEGKINKLRGETQ